MGLNLEDGKGRGYQASVNSDNKLDVAAVTTSAEHYVNHSMGEAYALAFSQSNTASGDCIFYMLNTAEKDLVIEGMTIGVTDCTANDSLYLKIGDSGTRNSATELTPVNMNAGSGKSATGTFEKGADLDGGAATLSGGLEVERLVMAGVTDLVSKPYNFEQDVILPKNRSLTMWVDGSGTGTWYTTVVFNFHEIESK